MSSWTVHSLRPIEIKKEQEIVSLALKPMALEPLIVDLKSDISERLLQHLKTKLI